MELEKLRKFIKDKKAALKDASFAIPLSRGMIVGLLLVFLCAIGWAYYMGLMVGRGQNPQTDLPGFASAEEPASMERAEAEQETPPAVAEVPETAGPSGSLPAQFERPVGEQTAAWPDALTKGLAEPRQNPPQRSAQAPARKAQPQKPPAARDNGPQYDFLYQIAAFRTPGEAETLKSQLAKAGIRASTRKSGRVTLVLASVRGRESDALAFRQKLKSRKLGEPLLLSRKQAPAKGGKR